MPSAPCTAKWLLRWVAAEIAPPIADRPSGTLYAVESTLPSAAIPNSRVPARLQSVAEAGIDWATTVAAGADNTNANSGRTRRRIKYPLDYCAEGQLREMPNRQAGHICTP